MSKYSRAGGKFCGSHTTLIPAAAVVADIADKCAAVTKISLGRIDSGLASAKGLKRVKILDSGACLLFKIRDNISYQEVRVYSPEKDRAKEYMVQEIKEEGFGVECM